MIYFYRAAEGHHLWPVGLELLVDLSHLEQERWGVTAVWFADMMFTSVEDLMAAFNGTDGAAGGGNVTQMVRDYKLYLPSKCLGVWGEG